MAIVRVKSWRGVVAVTDTQYDFTSQVAELRARNARSRFLRERSEAELIHEAAWKICGPDFDADEPERQLWTVEVFNLDGTPLEATQRQKSKTVGPHSNGKTISTVT